MSTLFRKQPEDLLLCVFVHGFNGNDKTFNTFPSTIASILQQVIEIVSVESIVFPEYKTRGDFSAAVDHFTEWLYLQVKQRERKRASGAAKKAKVVLCGHSMGGLLIADAIKSMKEKYQGNQSQPRIIAVLAFDTPYLGLHQNLWKNKVREGLSVASYVQSIASLLGGLALGASKPKSVEGAMIPKATNSLVPTTPAGGEPPTNRKKWLAMGGVALVATSTIAAAYYYKDKIISNVTSGMTLLTEYLEYVGALHNEPNMKNRLDYLVQLSQNHEITFRTFYTYLPPKVELGQGQSRTFITLPFGNTDAAQYFVAATNTLATDEIQAHTGMFDRDTNDCYDELEKATARSILLAIKSLRKTEKTMRVAGKPHNEEEELKQNRAKVAEDICGMQAVG
ncbi:SubName: Full=Uncharacterized protein {ECO:0000313/EMBL:CCA70684.1} [Serendipita indica DSM 11827]|nr:SubName: Full=Uncharacterized protein {ECO:0000313/EMBL:CCA70684.1} [Serendipita indica DSM 11827]